VIYAAQQANVRRFIHMSALGTRAQANSRYHQTKFAAEELLRHSGLDFTIFRPGLIHGPDGEFSQMLYGWAHGTRAPWFFMPYFGRGMFGQQSSKIQPVYIDDVAGAFVQAVDHPQAVGKTYDLVGPARYTWPELLHIASRILRGKPKVPVAIPAWEADLMLKLHFPVPFTREQLTMALEDNIGDAAPVQADFPGWQAQSLESTMTAYKDQMHVKIEA
jgi:NADH dehydrogenase